MNLSKIKIGMFFFTIFLLLWMLYPNKLFLGYIYEGQSELTRAEVYYLDYLKQRPTSKFVIKRLSILYKRMGEPEKALAILENLIDYRKTDWDMAQIYLQTLEEMQELDSLYKARIKIADSFINDKRIARYKLADLYDSALQYALWTQKTDEAYQLLLKIIPITPRPQDYVYQLVDLDKGFKRTDKLLEFLGGELKKQPSNVGIRTEMVSIYQVQKKNAEALKLLQDGLKITPFDKNLLIRITQVFNDLKMYNEAIDFAQKSLSLKDMKSLEKTSMMRLLATLYVDTGRDDEGIALFEKLTLSSPTDRDSWRGLIEAYSRLGNMNKVLFYMQEYLKKFEDDSAMKKNLAETKLYKLKDIAVLPLYREVLNIYPNPTFALDVAYLLLDRKMMDGALNWLLEWESTYGNAAGYQKTLVSVLVENKEYDKAYTRLKKVAGHNPALDVLKDLIYLAGKSGFDSEGREWVESMYSRFGDNPKILEEIGELYYFWGETEKAQGIFTKLLNQKLSLTPSYWLGEIEYGKGNKKEAFAYFKKFLSLYKNEKNKTTKLDAKALKARGRMEFNDRLVKDYEKALAKTPREQQFYFDVIDLLIENKKAREAESYFKRYAFFYPNDKQSEASTLARIAILDRDWKKAIHNFEISLTFDADNHFLRHDLAYAQDKDGQWRQALDTLNSLSSRKQNMALVKDLYRFIRDEKESHISLQFYFNDLGRDSFFMNQISARVPTSNKAYLTGGARYGFYDVESKNREVHAVEASLGAGFFINPSWELSATFDYAQTKYLKAPGITLRSKESFFDKLTFEQTIRINQATLDTPQALPAGGKEHAMEALVNYQALNRLTVNARYALHDYYLQSGDETVGQVFEPGIYYKILEKPSLVAGYRFSLGHVASDTSFFSRVSLVPDIRAHYLSLQVSHNIAHDFYYDQGFFAGFDTKRNLDLFEGDLWGSESHFKWYVGKNFILDGLYRYSSESQSAITGRSHEVRLGIFGYLH